jgi:hypothetical protein
MTIVKWISCRGVDLAEADDIRWTEASWKKNTRGVKTGEHEIEGKVEFCDREWVHVRVKSGASRADEGWIVESYKTDDLLRRRRSALGRGTLQRMTWTDESARASVKSEHRKPEPRVPERPTHAPSVQSHRRGRRGTRRKHAPKGRRKTQLTP